MTLGIDIAQYQAGIDLALAKRQGVEFVIVKAGGLNTGSLYAASKYSANVDRVRAHGLELGHYYVTGRTSLASPRRQAEFFVSQLYRYAAGDMLVLDNEKLDSHGAVFSDREAGEFLERVGELLPGANLWHYAGAADMRAHGPWPKVEDSGARFWVAAYGRNDGSRGTVPQIGRAVHMHQYTSSASIGGLPRVDANWSPLSLSELFKKTDQEDDIDMLSDADRQLQTELRDEVRGLSQRLDSVGGVQGLVDLFKQLDRDREAAADRRADTINRVTTREGQKGRAYVRETNPSEVVVVSETGPWIVDLRQDPNPAQAVANLNFVGWCQPWEDRHTLNEERWLHYLRSYDAIALSAGPLSASLEAVAYAGKGRPQAPAAK